MRSVYGDESTDEKQQRVFAVAGLMGSDEDWSTLREKWLSRTGGKIFHAAECESDEGDFVGVPHGENQLLYADLAKLISSSNLMGLGVAVSIQDFKELLAASVYGGEPYYLAFHTVVNVLGQWSSLSIPPDEVEFIFDRHPTNQNIASVLYDYVINQLDAPQFKKLMCSKVSFATRNEVGIQAADLLARESMKLLDNQIGPKVRPPRLSYQKLRQSGRIRFRTFTRGWCEGFLRKAQGDTYPHEDYQEWRKERGLADTFPNRLQYETYRYPMRPDTAN